MRCRCNSGYENQEVCGNRNHPASGGGGALIAVVDDEDVRRVELQVLDDVRHQPGDDAGISVEEVEHRGGGGGGEI